MILVIFGSGTDRILFTTHLVLVLLLVGSNAVQLGLKLCYLKLDLDEIWQDCTHYRRDVFLSVVPWYCGKMMKLGADNLHWHISPGL